MLCGTRKIGMTNKLISAQVQVLHPCCRHDIQTAAAVYIGLPYIVWNAHSSLNSRQACVSGVWCHRVDELPLHVASAPLVAVFRPFCIPVPIPIHYHMTRVLLLPFSHHIPPGYLWSLQ